MKKYLSLSLLAPFVLLLLGCGPSSDDSESMEPAPDVTAEVQEYYASKPEFFTFKTLADLPTDLTWQDGSHLSDIGSPEAKKGGTDYDRLQAFPRTLRTVGPDSNDSFRTCILDSTSATIGHR
ncbi:MAG: ABC transporter substrate-binding protein, partial [Pseudomonadales bacterium]|nr:ABC transporter substrate-binding protein [Pseudomonadales bacterium]